MNSDYLKRKMAELGATFIADFESGRDDTFTVFTKNFPDGGYHQSVICVVYSNPCNRTVDCYIAFDNTDTVRVFNILTNNDYARHKNEALRYLAHVRKEWVDVDDVLKAFKNICDRYSVQIPCTSPSTAVSSFIPANSTFTGAAATLCASMTQFNAEFCSELRNGILSLKFTLKLNSGKVAVCIVAQGKDDTFTGAILEEEAFDEMMQEKVKKDPTCPTGEYAYQSSFSSVNIRNVSGTQVQKLFEAYCSI